MEDLKKLQMVDKGMNRYINNITNKNELAHFESGGRKKNVSNRPSFIGSPELNVCRLLENLVIFRGKK